MPAEIAAVLLAHGVTSPGICRSFCRVRDPGSDAAQFVVLLFAGNAPSSPPHGVLL
jgi:hypothetical protein